MTYARKISGANELNISVVIPTLNEETHLGRTLAHLRKTSTQGKPEIIVVDGQSQDSTLSIANSLATQIITSKHRGRAQQMHEGALASSGDILLFLHADTHLPDNWQQILAEVYMSKSPPSATAFRMKFETDNWRYRFISWGARVRSRITGIPHGDQGIAVRREAYFQVGGFPSVPLMEEYYLGRKLRRFGRIETLPDVIVASTRRYTENGPLFNAFRNAFLIVLYYLGVSPAFLSKLYYWTRLKPQ